MRDYLQGTEFDMSKDFGAGSFGCPYRWRPLTFKVGDETYVNERATVTQQTGFSFVTQSRSWLPDVIGGILWFGVDDAGSCVYTPMYCSMVRIPETYAVGNGAMMEFSWNSAFWIFNLVSNFAYTRYNIIHPDIHERQQYLEKKFIVMTETADKEAQELYNKNPEEAVKYLTNFSVTTANELVYGWKKFFEDLFLKYMDGNIKYAVPGEKNPKVEFPGYNDDWKKRLVEDTGDKLKMR
jgi:dipeptidase